MTRVRRLDWRPVRVSLQVVFRAGSVGVRIQRRGVVVDARGGVFRVLETVFSEGGWAIGGTSVGRVPEGATPVCRR